jgi:hypothetical protein
MAANSKAAGTEALAWLLTGRPFLAEPADDWDQTVDLFFVQGSPEWRHIPLALIDLRVDFGIGQFLGFGRAQVFSSDRFSNDRIPTSIRTVALGAIRVV